MLGQLIATYYFGGLKVHVIEIRPGMYLLGDGDGEQLLPLYASKLECPTREQAQHDLTVAGFTLE